MTEPSDILFTSFGDHRPETLPPLDASAWNLDRPRKALLAALLPIAGLGCSVGDDPEALASEVPADASDASDVDAGDRAAPSCEIELAFDITIAESGYDGTYDVAVDADDNVIALTHHYIEGESFFGFELRAFDDDGTELWTHELPGSSNFNGIVLAPNNRVIAFGSTYAGDDRSSLVYVFDAAHQIPVGQPIVLNVLPGDSDWIEDAVMLGSDIVLAGGKQPGDGAQSPWIARIGQNGTTKWLSKPNRSDGGLDFVDVQPDNEIWATQGAGGYLLKYDAAGHLKKTYSGATKPPGAGFVALASNSLLFSNAGGFAAYTEALAQLWNDGALFSGPAFLSRYGTTKFAGGSFQNDGKLKLARFDAAGHACGSTLFAGIEPGSIVFGNAVGPHTIALGVEEFGLGTGRVIAFEVE